jgi:hypothetical protein
MGSGGVSSRLLRRRFVPDEGGRLVSLNRSIHLHAACIPFRKKGKTINSMDKYMHKDLKSEEIV